MFLFDQLAKRLAMPRPEDTLPGRAEPIATSDTHFVSDRPLKGPYPEGMEQAMFGLGCFWGGEQVFWKTPGVWVTAVGYSAGTTPNPRYKEVCTGATGHNEVVLVVFDPKIVTYAELLKRFWEAHDPTQGMRQGNDVGTQYRSGIYVFNEAQRRQAEASRAAYEKALGRKITTEIRPASDFYFAEAEHQQYLAKNPGGYCGHGGTGVACPAFAGDEAAA